MVTTFGDLRLIVRLLCLSLIDKSIIIICWSHHSCNWLIHWLHDSLISDCCMNEGNLKSQLVVCLICLLCYLFMSPHLIVVNMFPYNKYDPECDLDSPLIFIRLLGFQFLANTIWDDLCPINFRARYWQLSSHCFECRIGHRLIILRNGQLIFILRFLYQA